MKKLPGYYTMYILFVFKYIFTVAVHVLIKLQNSNLNLYTRILLVSSVTLIEKKVVQKIFL